MQRRSNRPILRYFILTTLTCSSLYGAACGGPGQFSPQVTAPDESDSTDQGDSSNSDDSTGISDSDGDHAPATPSSGDDSQTQNDNTPNTDVGFAVRSYDGSGNNADSSTMGEAHTKFPRYSYADYADGITTMGGDLRPNPRDVSNIVFDQEDSVPNARGLSSYAWQWGQLVDHDIVLTEEENPKEIISIDVPSGDDSFDPEGTGTVKMFFARSEYDPATGLDGTTPREQMNSNSSWLDGSFVYGSDDSRAEWLRTFQDGKLKVSDGNLLPYNDGTQSNKHDNNTRFFVAGDVRSNEQLGLTAIHTLMVREHNRLADQIKAEHPDWNDEQIYQKTRKFVGAFLQAITYHEFLPALVGESALPDYTGYDASVNANIHTEFSTVFFRFGHTMLPPELLRLNNDGSEAAEGSVALRDAFFQPEALATTGIDSLLMGLSRQPAQELDALVIDEVRNFLFATPASVILQDLVSLNIQRGRDHGIPDYNTMRTYFGLEPVTSIAEISSNPEVQARLTDAYGDVSDLDAFVGMLAEDHLPGTSTGALLAAVLKDQFTRLRDGDRFWYENDTSFTAEEIGEINSTRLSDIIKRNTNLTNVQDNVFFVPEE